MKSEKTSSLTFDGLGGQGYSRTGSQRLSGNHSGLTGVVNAGTGPREGNNGQCHTPRGITGNPTRSPKKQPPSRA